MILSTKNFQIDIAKLDKRLATIATSNYNGLVFDGTNFVVQWKVDPTNSDIDVINAYWDSMTEQVYNTPTASEQAENLAAILDAARKFGNALIVQFAMENVAQGITQAGKTRAVADYAYKVQYYLQTGSLYAAIEELEERIADPNMPTELAPFVTATRLTSYLNAIKNYLHIS